MHVMGLLLDRGADVEAKDIVRLPCKRCRTAVLPLREKRARAGRPWLSQTLATKAGQGGALEHRQGDRPATIVFAGPEKQCLPTSLCLLWLSKALARSGAEPRCWVAPTEAT